MLLLFPMVVLSWVCNKVPAIRNVLGIVFIPWAVIANTYAALIPSMGELDSRAIKLLLCGSWPFTWECWLFCMHKLDLESTNSATVALKKIVDRISCHDPIMRRAVMRVATGQPLDPN
jgi:hypothetical protein